MIDPHKLILAWELYQKGVAIQDIANHCGKHRETVSHWLKGIKQYGLTEYINYYIHVKKNVRKGRQVSLSVKEMIWGYQSKMRGISGYKIRQLLASQHHTMISVSKIYAIMKECNANDSQK